MIAETLTESPLSPASELGPFRDADYRNLPDEPRCELLYGRFYLSPSPSSLHQTTIANLWQLLRGIARKTGGFTALAPLDVALADHSVVQPDVIYVAAERRSIVGDRIDGAPDLLVEVLSPGTARRDRGEKLKLYAECGVKEYWVVDVAERQIEFLINRGGAFVVTMASDGLYRSPALPEITLDLAQLWSEVDADLRQRPGQP
ncbi:MAG TPA: Uma2 family endonuclease [Thermoanaerobaculia bacterium]